jgi:hypothetical protein
VQDSDDERLGATTIGQRKRCAGALEVEIGEKLERSLVIRADSSPGNIDSQVYNYPVM